MRVRRLFPDRIRIDIVERTPIAFLETDAEDGGCLVLAEGGIVVERASAAQCVGLLVRGAGRSGDAPGARLLDVRVVAALERLAEHGLHVAPFARIDVSDPEGIVLNASGGTEVRLGPLEDTEARIDALAALLDTIDLTEYSLIDLRFGGGGILVPRKVVDR